VPVDSTGTGTDIVRDRLEPILSSFEGNASEIIPILQRVQAEFGCLRDGALLAVSQFTGVPESRVYALATFYADFHLLPLGAKHVRVCRGASCYFRGATHILKAVERQLGIGVGETTTDHEYSLGTIGCTGTCARAPCVMIDDKVESRMTPQKVAKLFRKGGQI
jgi:NADH-quinone oxidoreductase subunit E